MKHVHFIGIGGSGLSAIAKLLIEKGYRVTGSDQTHTAFCDELTALGATIRIGHRPENVHGADLVIRSSAIPDDNVEVQAAIQTKIPVKKRSEILADLTQGKQTLAIAGTHGKTTTTAMAAWTLTQLALHPSFIIGGVSKNLKSNAHAGEGRFFVIEADEYDFMFHGLYPDMAIVTNMEWDHPDCFPSEENYQQAFEIFITHLTPGGILFLCHDRPETIKLAHSLPDGCKVFTYGLSPNADYSAINLSNNAHGCFTFDVIFNGDGNSPLPLGCINLQVPGTHNVQNALAVVAVAHQWSLPLANTMFALGEFQGTERRFDVLGEASGITIIDDYAHHPTEIQTTLRAARSRYPHRNLWVLWQPHTFSRTKILMDEYVNAFQEANHVVVTEIYAAREQNPGFSARQVVEKMQSHNTFFAETLDSATSYLLSRLTSGDVLLVLSAGDANKVSVEVLQGLKSREKQND